MDAPGDPRDDTIGDLVGRLIEDGRTYARAEVELLKQVARHRSARAKSGAIALSIGIVLLLSSLTALILGLVLGLATLVGPLAAGLIIAGVLAGAGYILLRIGLTGLRALSGSDEERQAIARGEHLP